MLLNCSYVLVLFIKGKSLLYFSALGYIDVSGKNYTCKLKFSQTRFSCCINETSVYFTISAF